MRAKSKTKSFPVKPFIVKCLFRDSKVSYHTTDGVDSDHAVRIVSQHYPDCSNFVVYTPQTAREHIAKLEAEKTAITTALALV